RDAVGAAARQDDVELALAFAIDGHDVLADATMRDVVARAPIVERPVAAHAQLGLERPRRIVHAGVDDLRVARAGLLPGARVALDDQRRPPGARQPLGTR